MLQEARNNQPDKLTAQENSVDDSRQIGKILLDTDLITISDVERILHKQKADKSRFGDAAVDLGLITQEELEQALAKQFSFSYLDLKDSNVSSEVVAAFDPFSQKVEGLRVLRSQLLLRWFSKTQKTLAIVSTERKEGKSYIAANLAVVFSQLGEKTLLIDANMRNPRQHEIFNLPNGSGLSTMLAGRGENIVQQIIGLNDLYVLPAGPLPPNPQELLSRSKFSELLEALKEEFDTILVDTPSGKSSSDALIITSKCGGALVVTRKNKTRIADIKKLKECMLTDGIKLAGSVLNLR